MTPLSTAFVILGAAALAACSAKNTGTLQGYVEGTYVYVSGESAGRLIERPAQDGAPVKEGALLFRLDDSNEKAQLTAAEARLAQAKAQLSDLQSGKRPEELSVLVAQVSAARTNFNSASDTYARQLALLERGVVSQTTVDNAKTARDAAEAQLQAAERQLEVARLPARPDEIDAAERNVAAEQATVDQAKIALGRRTVVSPASGMIEETYFEPGEQVAVGAPVVSLLPDSNKRIRFFLPERKLSEVKIGDRVSIACDNCPAGLTAEVTFVSSQAQFTPPIIYSRDNREKLVFRVDARPLDQAAALKVGQPIDVTLAGAPGS
ncbi:MAG: HlyD family efflux transporter periplasmic adaptor subunit [Rhizobiales bacterium]|nr:HlyD family efflux transporter periplasmic adaptor subunit [Hyphomicrobiales bacterium]